LVLIVSFLLESKEAGTIGHGQLHSSSKNLGYGDGGAIFTNDDALAQINAES
jgi:dTDP-4-amino-4,6-dideoxygalactose transaminase